MFRNRWNVTLIVLLVLIVASLACNAGATDSNDTVEVPTEQPTNGVPAEDSAGQPTPDPAENPTDEPVGEASEETGSGAETGGTGGAYNCPTPAEGTELYISEEFGYCFLYPADYSLNPDWNVYEYGMTAFHGQPLDPDSMEPVLVNVQIYYNGPAVDVSSAAEYAARWLEINALPGIDMPTEPASLGGHESVLVQHQPGMFTQQTAFTVVDGRKYSVTMQPNIGDFEPLDAEGQATWDLVTGSIVFFPPTTDRTWVQAADVCPTAAAGTTLHVNYVDGMCFLVPDGWTQDTNFGGSTFSTSEVLGEMEGFGEITPRMSVAFFGGPGATPEEVLAGFIEAGVDPVTFQEFTVDGYPAVEYIEPRGPFEQRGGMIVAERGSYSLMANPYDPDVFAESMADIDVAWDTITGSLAFFTPWR